MVSVLENTEQNLHGTASKVVTVLAPNWNSSFPCLGVSWAVQGSHCG